MKNILITGGAGFIGSNLSLKLLNKGYNVTVLDSLSSQIHGSDPEVTSPLFQSISGKVNFIHASINDRAALENAVEGQDAIVHFAAETGTGQSMYEIHKYVDININGTALLLDVLSAKKNSVQKVLVASSRSIYGEGKYKTADGRVVYPSHRTAESLDKHDFEVKYPGVETPLILQPTDEDSKIHPSSVYGITKQTQEQLVMTVCPTINIQPVALRYQNVYGPGQSLSNPYTGILSIFSTRIKNNNGINVFEDGLESRDFVFIDDVVTATIKALEMPEANNQIFNVGSGTATNVITVAETLKRLYGSVVDVTVSGNYRLGDIRHNYADLSKIQRLLDFTPEYDFDKGITQFVAWVNEQEVQNDDYEKSIAEMRLKGMFK
ncbi:NAD-dependent epimerase/dehydratase family protein [Chitinophaga sp. 22536]|uniref:NAD-dependent epimerase/dehydratase family protein n=1 Tax=unclassified Chitinophaga TaxID=2619133 RepID=UPI003F857250